MGGAWYHTVEVLEFVKSYSHGEKVVVEEAGGWRTGREEKVWRAVQANHSEKGNGVVRSGLVVVTLCRMAPVRAPRQVLRSWISL